MYTFNWALTAFRSESYIGSATALPDSFFYSLEDMGLLDINDPLDLYALHLELSN